MNTETFQREMTKLFEAAAISKVRYYCYPSGWDPKENLNKN